MPFFMSTWRHSTRACMPQQQHLVVQSSISYPARCFKRFHGTFEYIPSTVIGRCNSRVHTDYRSREQPAHSNLPNERERSKQLSHLVPLDFVLVCQVGLFVLSIAEARFDFHQQQIQSLKQTVTAPARFGINLTVAIVLQARLSGPIT